MTVNNHLTLIVAASLTAEQRVAAEALLALVNQAEGLDVRVNTGPSGFPDEGPDGPIRLLAYLDGEPAGFLSVDGWPEGEASLLVHPERRRLGIGRAMLDRAREQAHDRQYENLLLITEAASAAGKAFCEAAGARYRFSEYLMALDPAARSPQARRYPELELRPAAYEDAAAIARVSAAAFDDPEEEVLRRVERQLRQDDRRYYLATLDDRPVGTLRLDIFDGKVAVYAFGVDPALQGRGIGRQMLEQTVDALLDEGWTEILIEVETENRNALKLYQAVGFREQTEYRYYELNVERRT